MDVAPHRKHDPLCDEAWVWDAFMDGREINGAECWMCGLLSKADARAREDHPDNPRRPEPGGPRMTATAKSQPWTPPRWTPDVEDVFVRGLNYVSIVRGRIARAAAGGQPIAKDSEDLLRAAWILLEGANAIRDTQPVGERQRLAKALLLEDDAFFSDEAPEVEQVAQ